MQYNKLELFLSKPRLDRFLHACNNNQSKALELYKTNLFISQAFYPVLNLFEIILRNTLNRQLIAHFQNPDWILTEKNGFMSDKSLAASRYYLKNCIVGAERKLRNRGIQITAGRVLAEQSFGFWSSLFEPHHYRLLQGSIIHCFSLKPSHINRSSLATILNNIREFRNRVYHNEPVCFNNSSIDFSMSEKSREEIYNLLSWIDSELKGFVLFYDNIPKRILAGKRI